MKLEAIAAPHAANVVDMLEALLAEGHDGEYISFLFLAERLDGSTAAGVVGRFRKEPIRCLGELAVLNARLAHLAAKLKERREQIDFAPTGS